MKAKPGKKIEVALSDLSELLRPYTCGWVALSEDERRVVASGATLREAQINAGKCGYAFPVFIKIIPPDRGYIPAYL
jgi:hypothetical protein